MSKPKTEAYGGWKSVIAFGVFPPGFFPLIDTTTVRLRNARDGTMVTLPVEVERLTNLEALRESLHMMVDRMVDAADDAGARAKLKDKP